MKEVFELGKRTALEITVKRLLAVNNRVTTLEVKNQLRQKFPDVVWNQDWVSHEMNMMTQLPENKIVSLDSGLGYRIYQNSIGPVQPAQRGNRLLISKKEALQKIQSSRGTIFSAVFVKKDGTERTINCRYHYDSQPFILQNYILVKETPKKAGLPMEIKQINLDTLKSLKVLGQEYDIS